MVGTWRAGDIQPLVFSWQGQSGHDRHNTKAGARPLSVWAPEAAEAINAEFVRRTTAAMP